MHGRGLGTETLGRLAEDQHGEASDDETDKASPGYTGSPQPVVHKLVVLKALEMEEDYGQSGKFCGFVWVGLGKITKLEKINDLQKKQRLLLSCHEWHKEYQGPEGKRNIEYQIP